VLTRKGEKDGFKRKEIENITSDHR
jgi:hypothetical protein